MDMNAAGALSSYTYQSTLTQTGSANRALTQALATAQAQATQVGALFGSSGPTSSAAALLDSSSIQALASLAYSASSSTGNGVDAVQSLLSSLGSGTSALFSPSDTMPLSAAVLFPAATAAMVRYAYDQSQNPQTFAQQALSSAQQSLMTTSLNLLA